MSDDKLDEYRDKRDFDQTAEPAGEIDDSGARRFVVQEHHARALHWDLRLEHDGVLASWAVPKGIPDDPKGNRLAVRTEDHPLEYLDFHGDIPEGEYGAGVMTIWDHGTYDLEKWRDDEVIVVLRGERVSGRYVLFRTSKDAGGKNWMIHRMDPPSDPTREPMPAKLEPMLATSADKAPSAVGDKWAYEVKWDGIRAIAYVEGGRVTFQSRNGRDISATYPELRNLGPALGALPVVLDGEIIALEDGRPSFEKLQARMNVSGKRVTQSLVDRVPVVYVIFDVLWIDGHSTIGLPYDERRRLLEKLDLDGPGWQTPPAYAEGGPLIEGTREQGIEGVVAKRRDAPYKPGERSKAWLKLKNYVTDDFVVAGWVPGEGSRGGTIGALVLAGNDRTGALRYAGRVGTGFKQAELARLEAVFEPLARETCPISGDAGHEPHAHWLEPEIVASVRYVEMTRAGVVRAASYRGLRDDVDASTVRLPT